MSFLAVVAIGFIVGLVARFLMPGKDPAGFFVTILLGIAGAVVGTYAGQALGFYLPGEPAGFAMSVTGAMLLLFVGRVLARE